MKSIYFCGMLAIALSISPMLYAQGVKEGNYRFDKVDRPGLGVEFPYSKGLVANALKERLDKAGFPKQKTDHGFTYYKGVTWPEITPGQIDVYTKVDGKDNQSTVLLLVSKGYDNYVSSATDPAVSAKLKAFLESLLPDIKASQLQADIGNQEKAVREAEKDYKKMDKEGNKQSREKEQLEKDISDNVSDKAKTAETLDAEKEKLDDLKDQKK